MPGRLAARVVVVTGAASGIGVAISVALAQEGAQVALVDLAEPGAAEPVLAAVRGHETLRAQRGLGEGVEQGGYVGARRFGRGLQPGHQGVP